MTNCSLNAHKMRLIWSYAHILLKMHTHCSKYYVIQRIILLKMRTYTAQMRTYCSNSKVSTICSQIVPKLSTAHKMLSKCPKILPFCSKCAHTAHNAHILLKMYTSCTTCTPTVLKLSSAHIML